MSSSVRPGKSGQQPRNGKGAVRQHVSDCQVRLSRVRRRLDAGDPPRGRVEPIFAVRHAAQGLSELHVLAAATVGGAHAWLRSAVPADPSRGQASVRRRTTGRTGPGDSDEIQRRRSGVRCHPQVRCDFERQQAE